MADEKKRTPQLRTTEVAAKRDFEPIPMEIPQHVKSAIVTEKLLDAKQLTIANDGSWADDGRGELPVEGFLVALLLSEVKRGQGKAWQGGQTVTLTIVGRIPPDRVPSESLEMAARKQAIFQLVEEGHIKLLVADGRQRKKSIEFLNDRVIPRAWALFKENGWDRVKTINQIQMLAEAERPRNDLTEFNWIDPGSEIPTILVGGEITSQGGRKVPYPGFMRKGDTWKPEDGPQPYLVRVEWDPSRDPNKPEFLLRSVTDRTHVETPPSVLAKQVRRLLAPVKDGGGGCSEAEVATRFAVSAKTLNNWMLVGHLIPEVQEAVDANAAEKGAGVSWVQMRTMFFESAGKYAKPLAESKQREILEQMLAGEAGTGRAGRALRERLINEGKIKGPKYLAPTQSNPAPGATPGATPAATNSPQQPASPVPSGATQVAGLTRIPFPVGAKCEGCGQEVTPLNSSWLQTQTTVVHLKKEDKTDCGHRTKVEPPAQATASQQPTIAHVVSSEPGQPAAPTQQPQPAAAPAKKKVTPLGPHFSRALAEHIDSLPEPNPEEGADAYLRKSALKQQLNGAFYLLAYMDGSLDEAIQGQQHAVDFRDALTTILARAKEAEVGSEGAPAPAPKQDLKARVAAGLQMVFSNMDVGDEWPEPPEGGRKDSGWPESSKDLEALLEMQKVYGQIKQAYQDANADLPKGEFGLDYVLEHLLNVKL